MSSDALPVGPVVGPHTYNYTYVPPLAYADGLHLGDLPTLDWVLLVAKQAAKILLNSLLTSGSEDLKDALEEIKAAIKKEAAHEVLHFLNRDQQSLLF